MSAFELNKKDKKIPSTNDQKIDIKTEEWSEEPGKSSYLKQKFEGIDHTQKLLY